MTNFNKYGSFLMTESTKSTVDNELKIDFEKDNKEDILKMLKSDKNFNVRFLESGDIEVKLVLKG